MTTIIEMKSVSKSFGQVQALNDISLTIKKGEVVGFVGANGAGKTTAINTLLGIISPTSGQAKLFGQTVAPQSAHKLRQDVGYASGDMRLPERLTGRQYINFVISQYRRDCAPRLAELSREFKPEFDKPIHTLSRGNKQKIALIAAFVASPKLILLDEPTSGLDPVMQEVFLDTLQQIADSGGTIFMSSHNLSEVRDTCSRTILMRDGQIVRDLSNQDIKTVDSRRVLISSGSRSLRPPKSATHISTSTSGDLTTLEFNFTGSANTLQLWLSGIKDLQDVQIIKHDIDTIFDELYIKEAGD